MLPGWCHPWSTSELSPKPSSGFPGPWKALLLSNILQFADMQGQAKGTNGPCQNGPTHPFEFPNPPKKIPASFKNKQKERKEQINAKVRGKVLWFQKASIC